MGRINQLITGGPQIVWVNEDFKPSLSHIDGKYHGKYIQIIHWTEHQKPKMNRKLEQCNAMYIHIE